MKSDRSRGVVVDVPADITTAAQLRAFDLEMSRRHGSFRRHTHPLEQQRQPVRALRSAGLPLVELPPDLEAQVSALEQQIRSRTATEPEYQRVRAALRAFNDAAYVEHGRFRRRKTLLDKPDPRPEGAPRLMAAGAGEELVTRGLLMSSCFICVPVYDGSGAFATEAECLAACAPVDVPCCPGAVPQTLNVTFQWDLIFSGPCPQGSPQVFQITWDGTKWTGTLAPTNGGCSIQFDYQCNTETGNFDITIGSGGSTIWTGSVSCYGSAFPSALDMCGCLGNASFAVSAP